MSLRAGTLSQVTALLIAAACAGGCADSPSVRGPLDEAAFETVRALRYDYVHQASENLQRIAHDRLVETVQYSTEGDTMAAERFRVRYDKGRSQIVDSTTVGSFPAGFLARLFGPKPNHAPDSTTFEAILPDDPVYLSARNRDAYAFRVTQSGALPAVEITLRDPGEVESNLKRALLSYEPESKQVVRIELQREERSFLLESQSEARLSLRQTEDASWLPEEFFLAESRSAPLQHGYHIARSVRFEPAQPR